MTLVERVELVGRDASARAGETEQLRHLPDDIAAALRDTGMIGATTSLTAAFLPPEFAQEIYGDPNARASCEPRGVDA